MDGNKLNTDISMSRYLIDLPIHVSFFDRLDLNAEQRK